MHELRSRLAGALDATADEWRRTILILVALAGVVRVVALLFTIDLPLGPDPAEYDHLGRSVATGHGLGESLLTASGGPTAFRTPVFPWFVGAVYAVTDSSVLAVRVLHVPLGMVAVVPIALLGRELAGPRAGTVAGLLAALYPAWILSGNALMTEALSLPVFATTLLLAVRAARSGSVPLAALAGASGGVLLLTRPSLLVIMPFLALGSWLGWRRPGGRRLAPALAMGAATLAVVAPWVVRNVVVFDEPVLLTTVDGFNFSGTYNDQAAADHENPWLFRPGVVVPALAHHFHDPTLDESQLSNQLRGDALDFIADHPTSIGKVELWSSLRMADLAGTGFTRSVVGQLGYGDLAAMAQAVAWYLLVLGFSVALVKGAARAPWWWWSTPVVIWLSTAVIIGTWRHRQPVELFLFLAVAALAADIKSDVESPDHRQMGRSR